MIDVLLETSCAALRDHADANLWRPSMSVASFSCSLGSLTIRLILIDGKWEYRLGIERQDRDLDEYEVHQIRIELGGPLLLSRWTRVDARKVTIAWYRRDGDVLKKELAYDWLECWQKQRGGQMCQEETRLAA
jgi:hypothetical protein